MSLAGNPHETEMRLALKNVFGAPKLSTVVSVIGWCQLWDNACACSSGFSEFKGEQESAIAAVLSGKQGAKRCG